MRALSEVKNPVVRRTLLVALFPPILALFWAYMFLDAMIGSLQEALDTFWTCWEGR